jgi:hypothetical protein
VIPHGNPSVLPLLDHLWVSLLDDSRTRESVLPRQSSSSLILASILADGDSAFCKAFVFMLIALSFWKITRDLCHIRALWPVYFL